MKITFILKDLSEAFYEGGFYSFGLNNLNNLEKWLYLKYLAARKELKITMKVGNSDSFRDKVELNQIIRDKDFNLDYKLEARRGYKLVTFNVTP